jgi:hypothetical protein
VSSGTAALHVALSNVMTVRAGMSGNLAKQQKGSCFATNKRYLVVLNVLFLVSERLSNSIESQSPAVFKITPVPAAPCALYPPFMSFFWNYYGLFVYRLCVSICALAVVLPWLHQFGCPLSLPLPCHAGDWRL